MTYTVKITGVDGRTTKKTFKSRDLEGYLSRRKAKANTFKNKKRYSRKVKYKVNYLDTL